MGFFRTVWLWIKRLLFIAAMGMCIVSSVGFIADGSGAGLAVFLAVLGIVLSLGNIVLYFMFDLGARFIVILGLVAHLILEIILCSLSGSGSGGIFIVINICCVAACLVMVLNIFGILFFMSRKDTERLANILTGKENPFEN